ncbi:hypothetical protein [Methylobacterium sp. CM6247]
MKRLMTMREALESPHIFGTILPGESWANWRVILIASQGEPLTDAERVVFKELTGREREPDEPCDEVWGVVGRLGRKTRAFAVAASYFAGCVNYDGDFAPGQRARIPVMATGTRTATEASNYLLGIFTDVPFLAELVIYAEPPTRDTIRLTNRIDITVTPASFKTVRGATLAAVVCNEIAFWHIEDAANPDKEILRALRPAPWSRHPRRPVVRPVLALCQEGRGQDELQDQLWSCRRSPHSCRPGADTHHAPRTAVGT